MVRLTKALFIIALFALTPVIAQTEQSLSNKMEQATADKLQQLDVQKKNSYNTQTITTVKPLTDQEQEVLSRRIEAMDKEGPAYLN